MTEDLEVITYLQESLALTSFLYPPLSASWSLIHLNLIPIASSAVGQPGRVVSLTVKLAFLQKHFADRENSGKIWPLFFMGTWGGLPCILTENTRTNTELHFYPFFFLPLRDKNFFKWNSRFTRQIRCGSLSKAKPCVIVMEKGNIDASLNKIVTGQCCENKYKYIYQRRCQESLCLYYVIGG